MDIAPLSPTSAAEAVRANGSAQAQRKPAAAGFGAALDRALTRPEPLRRDGEMREVERRRQVERDDEEDRIAAAQQSAWLAARREAPAPPAAAAAVAMARRIEAARESAAAGEAAVARAVDAAEDAATGTEAAAASAATTTDAGTAAANASAVARAVTDVERSLDALAPEFRGRLERVIARMEAEGHEVTVAETHRDAERQNHLYEQGRTRPGPVVTWTRNSNHMQGRAADLVIDGTYDNPAGYARLARIAAEEGLQTLGPRDAGHVELRGATPLVRTPAGSAAQQTQPELIGPMYVQRNLGVAQVAAVAQVAPVASVAGVAQVAQVATVAQVAQPGSYAPIAQSVRAQAIARPIPAEGVRTSAADASPATTTASSSHVLPAAELAVAAAAGKTAQDGYASRDASADGEASQHAASAEPTTTQTAAPFSLEGVRTAALRGERVDAVQRADVAGRLDRVQALQDAASAQPLSQVTLRVESEDGTSSRINVGLRGNTVGATIDAADPLAAASMRAHVAELRHALERQGLDPSSLLVRTAARLEGSEAGRLASVLTGADALATLASAAGRESTPRDGGNGQNQQYTAPRRDPDAQRQRHNRNGKEDRP